MKHLFQTLAALVAFALFSCAATASGHLGHLLPQPRSIELTSKGFKLSDKVKVRNGTGFEGISGALSRFLQAAGLKENAAAAATITLNRVETIEGTENHDVPLFDNEAYRLTIASKAITIEAVTRTGIIRALQTLEQMLQDNKAQLPGAVIVDWPAFKVRGFMHDIGRSYLSMEELKEEIDLLARFKVNVFQWHLTDKHGFRFQSVKHPNVNTNFTPTRSQKYYTQAECRELQDYAWERGMTLIPEIDMPGHSARFEGAVGWTMASEEGKAILKDILAEVAATFDKAPYIHIGGDETAEATKEYINEMAGYIRETLQRKVMVWNPWGQGQSNLVDPATMQVDMCTNWATAGRKVTGIPNIDMRYNYVNHFDMFADLAGIYRSNILYETKGTADVAGTITGIWNDRLISDEKLIVKENNLYANVLAIADRAWKGGGKQYIETGGAYLPNSGEEYEEFKDWEERFLFHKATTLRAVQEKIPYVRQSHMRWNLSKSYANDGMAATAFEPENKEVLTPQPGDITVTGAGIWLNHIWAGTVPSVLGKAAQSKGQTRYAWTYVHSDKEQTVGLQFQTYDYSRSDRGAAPANGKWDMMESRVWINDTEILPAEEWTTAGSGEEDELGNVNFTARRPIPVTLKAGWNKVVVKLPYVNASPLRGNKWQYTCFFTDLDGINAVEGLRYDPNGPTR